MSYFNYIGNEKEFSDFNKMRGVQKHLEKNQELFCCAIQCPYYKDCKKGKKKDQNTFDYSFTCNKESGFQDFVVKRNR